MVDITYPYNAIFGRNSIIKFAVVINQAYLCMKIPTAGGVITILGNQEETRRCKDNVVCAMRNVHAIEASNNDIEEEEAKPLSSERTEKEGVTPAEHTKKSFALRRCTILHGDNRQRPRRSRRVQVDTIFEKQSRCLRMVIFGPARSQSGSYGARTKSRSKG